MTPILYSLPYDPTGTTPRNRVVNEYHDLSSQTGLQYRTLTLNHGYFYTDKQLEISDGAGYVLDEDDYQCLVLSEEATAETGLETAALIVIVNPRVGHEVFVNASMVGGQYTNLDSAIASFAAGLLNPTRDPTWRNVENKPDRFEVGGHLHAMWELYGFEGYCDAIDRITDARLFKSAQAYRAIGVSYEAWLDQVREDYMQLMRDLALHISQPNPHLTTQTHVGLSEVQNLGVITAAEAATLDFNSVNRYLVPGRYKQMIDVNFLPDLQGHVNDNNNPHGVTAAQANTRTITEANAVFDQKLGKDETAASTLRINGMGWAEFYAYMRSQLDASQINSGILYPGVICADPSAGAGHAVVGNNQAVPLRSAVVPYMAPGRLVVYVSGTTQSTAAAVLAATYSDMQYYPAGTLGLTMYSHYSSGSYGNGALIRDYSRLVIYTKNQNNVWT